ncbi:hypothetical protein FB007_10749 [Sinorhizobium medicae]|nr:hypothetical protein FB007_10749 [Sinorhizobium medicae]
MLRRILPLAAIAVFGLFNPGAASAEQVALTSTVSVKNDLKYLLYTPDGYDTSTESYPLVVWLHGGDQGGSDIEKVKSSGIPKLIEEGKQYPFLVFSPQNPSEELLYPIEKVDAALEEVVSKYRVDRFQNTALTVYESMWSVLAEAASVPGPWLNSSQISSPLSSRSPGVAIGITSIERTRKLRSGSFMAQTMV